MLKIPIIPVIHGQQMPLVVVMIITILFVVVIIIIIIIIIIYHYQYYSCRQIFKLFLPILT